MKQGDEMNSLTLIRGLAFLMGFAILAMTLPKLINKPLNQFHLDHIGLEWERDFTKANGIIDRLGRERMMRELNIDSFLFVPVYVAFFILLAFHLRSTSPSMGNFLFYGIIAGILLAGIADWLENFYTYQIAKSAAPEGYAAFKYHACFVKWSLIALTVAFASFAFLFRGNIWAPLAGFTTALVMLTGTAINHPLVQWGYCLMGFFLVIIAIFP
jgi:hypothetical protein